MDAEIEKIRNAELDRVKEILALGRSFGFEKESEAAIFENRNVDEFRKTVLGKLPKPDSKIQASSGADTPAFRGRGPFIGKRFAELFGTPNMGTWKSPEEWGRAVANNDPLLKRGHSEFNGPAGGFLLPSLVAQMFVDNSMEQSIVLPRCRIFPMEKDSLRVPALEVGDHSQNVYGGISASWKAEGVAATDQSAHLREINFVASKLFLYTVATNELVADTGISGIIDSAFKSAASHFLDTAFISGVGVGSPLGILAAGNGALLTVNRNTAGTIKYLDLCAMLAKLNPQSFPQAVWLAHPTCLEKLAALIVYDAATAITAYPLIGENGAMSLLSRPVIVSEKVGKLGANYDLCLVDFSQYGVAMRQDIFLQSNEGELFSRDSTAFRLTLRVDSMPLWSEPLTLIDGVSKVSPFVALI